MDRPAPPTGPTLLDLGREELAAWLEEQGEPSYRARQIRTWLYRRFARTVEAMTDLPAGLRERLAARWAANPFVLAGERSSGRDGTRKLLLEARDGTRIEAVVLPQGERLSLCVSTQAGCDLGCRMCATGRQGFERNLTAGEILGQVSWGSALAGRRVDNVVLMGMGEPLLNLGAVTRALATLSARWGFGVGTRRVTLSTVGVVPAIGRLAASSGAPNLAVSLHAPTQQLRETLVPAARRWRLPALLDAADRYAEKTGKLVTYEYVLVEGWNASLSHADALGRLLRDRAGKVNLLPLNPVKGSPLRPPGADAVRRFRARVGRYGLTVTVRAEHGGDIAAACGQLRAEAEEERTKPRGRGAGRRGGGRKSGARFAPDRGRRAPGGRGRKRKR